MSAFGQRIDAALAIGDMASAASHAEAALAAGERSAWLLNMVAWKHEQAGDFTTARGLLDEALRLDPHDPLLHISLGAILRQEGQLEDAIAKLTATIPSGSTIGALWLERGYAHEASGLLKAAADDYRYAARLEPSAPALGSLASVLARQGQHDEARAAAEAALRHDPQVVSAQIALARSALATGHDADARDRLTRLLTRPDLHVDDRLVATSLLGDVEARLGAHDRAYAAYVEAKAAFAARPDAPRPQDGQRAFVARLAAEFAAIPSWPETTPDDPNPTLVFLIGFPRSGTTLVENILASIPGVSAIEERPTLRAADEAYLVAPGGLARLAEANAAELAPLRAAYWDAARRYGMAADTRMLIDMDPLKGIKLPLIARLHSNAKIIVMLRDPRDVVWSCFKTPFAVSAAAFEFTTLERTARHYAGTMAFQEACLATLPLTVHQLRYETLVRDFDQQTQSLCASLDLPWTKALRDFARTSEARGVTTASASQIGRGLYDGSGQWQPYAAFFEPVMPILAPWIEKFGYALD
jgi:tetratricopeptide (TPR) repeat protein